MPSKGLVNGASKVLGFVVGFIVVGVVEFLILWLIGEIFDRRLMPRGLGWIVLPILGGIAVAAILPDQIQRLGRAIFGKSNASVQISGRSGIQDYASVQANNDVSRKRQTNDRALRSQPMNFGEVKLSKKSDSIDEPEQHNFDRSPTTARSEFRGVRELSNDEYKLYLVDEFKISKNDVLGKFVFEKRLYPDVDTALEAAMQRDLELLSAPNSEAVSSLMFGAKNLAALGNTVEQISETLQKIKGARKVDADAAAVAASLSQAAMKTAKATWSEKWPPE